MESLLKKIRRELRKDIPKGSTIIVERTDIEVAHHVGKLDYKISLRWVKRRRTKRKVTTS